MVGGSDKARVSCFPRISHTYYSPLLTPSSLQQTTRKARPDPRIPLVLYFSATIPNDGNTTKNHKIGIKACGLLPVCKGFLSPFSPTSRCQQTTRKSKPFPPPKKYPTVQWVIPTRRIVWIPVSHSPLLSFGRLFTNNKKIENPFPPRINVIATRKKSPSHEHFYNRLVSCLQKISVSHLQLASFLASPASP